jgi:hypothetical protein
MDVEIRPEPVPREREAIELALLRLVQRGGSPPAYRSAWRRAGITESLDGQLPATWTASASEMRPGSTTSA